MASLFRPDKQACRPIKLGIAPFPNNQPTLRGLRCLFGEDYRLKKVKDKQRDFLPR